jgi:hypothetical protein
MQPNMFNIECLPGHTGPGKHAKAGVGRGGVRLSCSRPLHCHNSVISLHGCDKRKQCLQSLTMWRGDRMVTLLTALVSLVDEWKQHVGPGVPMDQVLGKIDTTLAAQMAAMTSESPTRSIVSAINSALSAQCCTAADAAEDFAEGYGSKKSLLAETTLEGFLSDIWPKAPRSTRTTRPNRSGRTWAAQRTL